MPPRLILSYLRAEQTAAVLALLPERLLPQVSVRLAMMGTIDPSIVAQADLALSRGGCVLESGAGRVDATMETQLQRIESLFHEQLHAHG